MIQQVIKRKRLEVSAPRGVSTRASKRSAMSSGEGVEQHRSTAAAGDQVATSTDRAPLKLEGEDGQQ